jgi:hypothetical protein
VPQLIEPADGRAFADLNQLLIGNIVIEVVTRALIATLMILVTAQASSGPRTGPAGGDGRNFNHTYRVIGSVRLLFFWVSSDDIGGARVVRRERQDNLVLSLLIGSDPRRAPRQVNEWGYIRESASGGFATVFGVRTLTDGSSPEEAERRRNQSARSEKTAEMGVLCSTVSPLALASRTTTASVGRDVTYHDLGRVVSAIEPTDYGKPDAQWKRRGTARPTNGYAGFLIALDHLIGSNVAVRASKESPVAPRLTYVYKDTVYDLVSRPVVRVPQMTTHVGVLHHLLRNDVTVVNRATGDTTDFSVTYGAEGTFAGVPIQMRYQPNWWLRLELELDGASEVPADPLDDASMSARVASVCGAGED